MVIKTAQTPTRSHLAPLLTVEDLERMLRVGRRTVSRLCKRGQLPLPLKVGGQNRWRPDEVNAAINAMSVTRGQTLEPNQSEMVN